MASLGELERDNLIVGSFPTVVMEIELTGPIEFKRGDVIAQLDDGTYALVDSSGTSGIENPIGIICDNIKVLEDITTKATMYVKGEYNERALNFGGDDTAETHKRRMTEIGLIVRKTSV